MKRASKKKKQNISFKRLGKLLLIASLIIIVPIIVIVGVNWTYNRCFLNTDIRVKLTRKKNEDSQEKKVISNKEKSNEFNQDASIQASAIIFNAQEDAIRVLMNNLQKDGEDAEKGNMEKIREFDHQIIYEYCKKILEYDYHDWGGASRDREGVYFYIGLSKKESMIPLLFSGIKTEKNGALLNYLISDLLNYKNDVVIDKLIEFLEKPKIYDGLDEFWKKDQGSINEGKRLIIGHFCENNITKGIPYIIKIFNDDKNLRGFSAIALAKMKEKSIIPTIKKMLEIEEDIQLYTALIIFNIEYEKNRNNVIKIFKTGTADDYFSGISILKELAIDKKDMIAFKAIVEMVGKTDAGATEELRSTFGDISFEDPKLFVDGLNMLDTKLQDSIIEHLWVVDSDTREKRKQWFEKWGVYSKTLEGKDKILCERIITSLKNDK